MPPKEANLPIIGGVIAAIGAGLCCAGPLVLLLLGVSGSWIGNLTLLAPFRPIFILVVVALFIFSGWKLYRPLEACQPGAACAIPQVRKRQQVIFWLATCTALILVSSNYWIIWFI